MTTSKTSSNPQGKSTREILDERENTYGGFENNARIHSELLTILTKEIGRRNPTIKNFPVQHSALMHITGKLARIVSGDLNYDDNWQDIAGYAQLVVDHLKKQEELLPEVLMAP